MKEKRRCVYCGRELKLKTQNYFCNRKCAAKDNSSPKPKVARIKFLEKWGDKMVIKEKNK